MAVFVISLNTNLLTGILGFNSSTICHAIASPSRSGSVAINNSSAFLSAAFKDLTVFTLFGETVYSAEKSFSTSIPKLLLGRSRI